MLFDSVPFLFFLVPVFAIHWLLRGRARMLWLLLASYLFYGSWDWRFLGLILLSTAIDYTMAILADRARERGGRGTAFVVTSAISNLGILGVFKYLGFFAESLHDALQALGVSVDAVTLDIVLPVGISFYTFQTLAYTIDVWRGTLRAERDPLLFALYVAWFPQLVAGPIERPAALIPQLRERRRFDAKQVSDGLILILWGLFKKMVVADRAATLVNVAFGDTGNAPATSGVELYVAVCAFALQIYGDFSGYTDIARGTSKLFGVELRLNFRQPYFALGPSDFWRRWHMSLSTWLRDYLYISLGGNRRGPTRTHVNLFLTMLLGGLWHGARWNFVLWGAFHGLILIVERLTIGAAHSVNNKVVRALRMLVMLQFTLVGWFLFRIESLAQAGELLQRAGSNLMEPGRAYWWAALLAAVALPVVVMDAYQEARGRDEPLYYAGNLLRFVFACFLLFCLLTFRVRTQVEFIYFQF